MDLDCGEDFWRMMKDFGILWKVVNLDTEKLGFWFIG